MLAVRRIYPSFLLRSRLVPLLVQETAPNVKTMWRNGLWAAPQQSPSNQPSPTAKQSQTTQSGNNTERKCPCGPKKKTATKRPAPTKRNTKASAATAKASATSTSPASLNSKTYEKRLKNAYHMVRQSNELDVLKHYTKSALQFVLAMLKITYQVVHQHGPRYAQRGRELVRKVYHTRQTKKSEGANRAP